MKKLACRKIMGGFNAHVSLHADDGYRHVY